MLATERIPDAAIFDTDISPVTDKLPPILAPLVTESEPPAAILFADRFPVAVMFPPAVTLFNTSRFAD